MKFQNLSEELSDVLSEVNGGEEVSVKYDNRIDRTSSIPHSEIIFAHIIKKGINFLFLSYDKNRTKPFDRSIRSANGRVLKYERILNIFPKK